jgi:hypothetical protein
MKKYKQCVPCPRHEGIFHRNGTSVAVFPIFPIFQRQKSSPQSHTACFINIQFNIILVSNPGLLTYRHRSGIKCKLESSSLRNFLQSVTWDKMFRQHLALQDRNIRPVKIRIMKVQVF